MPDPVQVQRMFGRIAGRYDLLNRVLSVGIDQRWRKRALALIEDLSGARVADICCGTGDLALAQAAAGARVVGIDFTAEMLPLARKKGEASKGGRPPLFVRGDALELPLPDDSVDAATVAFGIRNVADRGQGLGEMARVVRPGGRVVVLEFSMPEGAVLGRLYRGYFTRVLPRVGGLVSSDRDAYEYLPRTVLAWPDPESFRAEFEQLGLIDCGFQRLSRGIACLHYGTVPAVV